MFAEFKINSLPPTINNYYGRTSRTVYKKDKAREWQAQVIEQLCNKWENKPALTSRLELQIRFVAGNNRKWDIDNRIKPLQDCLERAGVIENDRQIERLSVRREYGTADQTHIIVKEIEE